MRRGAGNDPQGGAELTTSALDCDPSARVPESDRGSSFPTGAVWKRSDTRADGVTLRHDSAPRS